MLPNLHFKYKFRLSRKAINETFIDTQKRLNYRIFGKDTKNSECVKACFFGCKHLEITERAENFKDHVAKEVYTKTRMTKIQCFMLYYLV